MRDVREGPRRRAGTKTSDRSCEAPPEQVRARRRRGSEELGTPRRPTGSVTSTSPPRAATTLGERVEDPLLDRA